MELGIVIEWQCFFIQYFSKGSTAYRTASQFGQGSGPVLMSEVQCTGRESHLVNCSYSPLIPSSCSHAYDVGVKCEGLEIVQLN